MDSVRLATYAEKAWWKGSRPANKPLPGSEALAAFLKETGQCVLFTSRQASVLGVVSSEVTHCNLSYHSVRSPMGLSLHGSALAIGTYDSIDVYQALPGAQPGEVAFLKVASHLTGPVSVHEVAWVDSGVAFVNTLFSAICVTKEDCNFEVVWSPAFVGEIGPIDSCHLNGMAMSGGSPRFVTALAETGGREGWRQHGPDQGVLIDLESGSCVRGLSLPHSPQVIGDSLWLLESGKGRLIRIDASGTKDEVASARQVWRGLALCGRRAVIGASQIRQGSESHACLQERFGPTEGARLALVDTLLGKIDEEVLLPGLQEISSLILVPHSFVSLVTPPETSHFTYVCRRS